MSYIKYLAYILLACSAFTVHVDCVANTVHVCMPDEDRPPFLFLSHDGQTQWLVRKAAENRGDSVEFIAVPWKRCLQGTKLGTYDAALDPVFDRSLLPDIVFPMKEGQVDAERSLALFSQIVLRRVGSAVSWDGQRFVSLNSPVLFSAGVLSVQAKLDALNVKGDGQSSHEVLTMRKLVAGRGEIAIMLPFRAGELIRQDEFRGKVEILPEPFLSVPIYLAFNRKYYEKSTPHVEAIWTEIKRLRATREWKQIAPTPAQ